MPEENILQLGTVAILFFIFIREFFAYLRNKKNKNGINKEILSELQLMNSNHLNTICRVMAEGNKEIVKAINEMDKNVGDKVDSMEKSLGRQLERIIGRGDKL